MSKYVMIRVLAESREQFNEIAALTGETQIGVVERVAKSELMSRFDSDGLVAEALRLTVKKGDARSDDELVVAVQPVHAHVSQVRELRRLWQ